MRLTRSLGAAIVLLLTAGCSGEQATVDAAAPAATTSTSHVIHTPGAVQRSCLGGTGEESFNAFVNEQSDAALVGETIAISEVKYDTPDGKAPKLPDYDPKSGKPYTGPIYAASSWQILTVRVDEVIFDSNDLRLQPGKTVDIQVADIGPDVDPDEARRASGRPWPDFCDAPPHRKLTTGAKVVYALDKDEAVTYFAGRRGKADWRVENGQAVNADPGRTLPADQLIQKLKDERARGRIKGETPEQARDSSRSPLGGDNARYPR